MLKDRYGVCHLATGDLLRAEVSSGSDLGQTLKSVMAQGETFIITFYYYVYIYFLVVYIQYTAIIIREYIYEG